MYFVFRFRGRDIKFAPAHTNNSWMCRGLLFFFLFSFFFNRSTISVHLGLGCGAHQRVKHRKTKHQKTKTKKKTRLRFVLFASVAAHPKGIRTGGVGVLFYLLMLKEYNLSLCLISECETDNNLLRAAYSILFFPLNFFIWKRGKKTGERLSWDGI